MNIKLYNQFNSKLFWRTFLFCFRKDLWPSDRHWDITEFFSQLQLRAWILSWLYFFFSQLQLRAWILSWLYFYFHSYNSGRGYWDGYIFLLTVTTLGVQILSWLYFSSHSYNSGRGYWVGYIFLLTVTTQMRWVGYISHQTKDIRCDVTTLTFLREAQSMEESNKEDIINRSW